MPFDVRTPTDVETLTQDEAGRHRAVALVSVIGASCSSAVSDRLRYSNATIRPVSHLEDRGLLSRCLCDTDRRGIYTDAGRPGTARTGTANP